MGLGNSKNQIEFAGKIYTVERLVGRGAFGKVYVVATKDGELVALKQLSKAALLSKKAVQGTLREREFLAELEHGFLVNLRGAFQNSTHLLMLLDFMKGGDLTYHLDRRPGQSLPEDHVKFYIANICLCLEYVHSQRIVHRDLKPDNVLLNAKGYALLTDFNVARRLENDDKIAGYAGTFAYMAPELFIKGCRYTTKVDIWSLGIIMFRLLFGRVPWEYPADRATLDWLSANPEPNFRIDPRDELRQQTAKRILRGRTPIPGGLSAEAHDLLQQMIAPADERLTVAQVKGHPWFQSIDWESMLAQTLETPFSPEEKANVDASLFVEDVFAGKTKELALTSEEQSLFYHWNWVHPRYAQEEAEAIKAHAYKPRKKPAPNSILKSYPKLRLEQEKYLKSVGAFDRAKAPAASSSSSSLLPSSSASPASSSAASLPHLSPSSSPTISAPSSSPEDDYCKPEPELGRNISVGDADLVPVSDLPPIAQPSSSD